MNERILTVDQAAELLQLKPQTVREYIKAGKLKANKIGKSWRILQSDVMALVSGKSENE